MTTFARQLNVRTEVWIWACATLLLAGCTRVSTYHDSRAYLAPGALYIRSTSVNASDDDTADVQAEGQLSLPRPIKGVEPHNGGWRWWDRRDGAQRAGWEPTRAEAVAMQGGR